MPRDAGLEALVHETLGSLPGITEKALFGGWAFMLHRNLLCGVRPGSIMLRVGRESETWAIKIAGVTPVVMRNRHMHGYIRLGPEAYSDDAALTRLLTAAVEFTSTLPRKP